MLIATGVNLKQAVLAAVFIVTPSTTYLRHAGTLVLLIAWTGIRALAK
jgi:hypothetical protein